MKTEFTKGEWKAIKPRHSNGFWYVNSEQLDCGSIATCYHGIKGDSEAEANAKLIAAAPDLLAALNETIDLINWGRSEGHFDDTVYNKAISAIKKATK